MPAPVADEIASWFADTLQRRVIRSGDRAGFVVNALLVPYLLSAVRMISRIKVITHPRARLRGMGIAQPPTETHKEAQRATAGPISLIAIGASTGGPGALLTVLQGIPRLPVPLLIVLHIEEPFGTDPNDLALDAMSHMIESSVREMMGEPLAPQDAEPGGFIQT